MAWLYLCSQRKPPSSNVHYLYEAQTSVHHVRLGKLFPLLYAWAQLSDSLY